MAFKALEFPKFRGFLWQLGRKQVSTVVLQVQVVPDQPENLLEMQTHRPCSRPNESESGRGPTLCV